MERPLRVAGGCARCVAQEGSCSCGESYSVASEGRIPVAGLHGSPAE